MERLDQLWMEMLDSKTFTPGRDQSVTLICRNAELVRLIELSWKKLQRQFPGWQVRIGEKGTAASGCLDLDALSLPPIIGLSAEEAMPYVDWESYRKEILSQKSPMCAGEFLCQLFEALAEGKSQDMLSFQSRIDAEDSAYMVWKCVRHDALAPFFYFDNTYDGQLTRLQQVLRECLDEFDRICRKHHISYFLAGGTLLGAVRHQAMIPWDDDIDVMMLRPEYEKFVKVVEQEIGKDFFYQSNRTDPWYHSVFDKIRRNNTIYMTYFSKRYPRMHQGIFIDIFVHDRTAASKLGQKLHVFFTLFARSLVFHKWEGTDMHFYGKWKGLCRFMTWFKNHSSMKRLEKIQLRVISWFSKRNTGWLYDGTGDHLRRAAFPESWLSDHRMGKLNGKEYPIPAEAEKYLEYLYGKDYLRLPPPQERKATHPIALLQFEE